MDNKIYKKISGKFVQVSDDDSLYMYLRDGFYLVHCYPCGRSISRVEPDKISLKAAMEISKEAMVKAMQKAAAFKPHRENLSRKERKAYAAYQKIMGEDVPAYLSGACAYEIVEAGLNVLL